MQKFECEAEWSRLEIQEWKGVGVELGMRRYKKELVSDELSKMHLVHCSITVHCDVS